MVQYINFALTIVVMSFILWILIKQDDEHETIENKVNSNTKKAVYVPKVINPKIRNYVIEIHGCDDFIRKQKLFFQIGFRWIDGTQKIHQGGKRVNFIHLACNGMSLIGDFYSTGWNYNEPSGSPIYLNIDDLEYMANGAK